MPSKPTTPQSTRLENLSFDPQGAAFDLEGRPIRLNAEGYAGPVASMQEFYHLALSDYYRRSAELSRQAPRPSLLGRLVSWVGRCFERLRPAAPAPGVLFPLPPPPTVPGSPTLQGPSPQRGADLIQPRREAALAPETPPIISQRVGPSSGSAKPSAAKPAAAAPPLLHVVFADRDGVHVIWQLAAAGRESGPKGRGPVDAKTASPRLELTYSLDSSMAQRLQDCYGQLAQLGYKITGLEAVRAIPEKPGREKKSPEAAPTPPTPAAAAESAEKSTAETPKAASLRPPPRKARPDPGPLPVEAARPAPEPPNPSFLPGI